MAFITIDGENLIAAKQGAEEALDIDEFVLANIAGLGAEPGDRIESMPDPGDIVDQRAVTHSGYVNDNQVVYSLTLDSTIGDYDFNWVGIKSAEGTLIAVEYLPSPVSKFATSGGVPGNNLVRNFLLAYSGIQATTAIGVPAETWQIDFTTRLLEIDERERSSNFDIYGQGAFFNTAFKVAFVSGTTFSVAAGVAYVGGIRLDRAASGNITATPWPTAVWIDASLEGDINGVQPVYAFVVSNSPQSDYTDGNGFKHYLTKIASMSAAGAVTDLRSVRPEAFPFAALDYPTALTSNNQITVTPASATNGGTVSIAAGTMVMIGQETVVGSSGRMVSLKTPAYTSADLAASSMYYLRAYEQNGVLVVYTQKGGDSNTPPGSLRGTPDGASGGGFDSTVIDMLIARVVTGSAGSTPTVTMLANHKQLFGQATARVNVSLAFSFTTLSGSAITLNWARKPARVNVSLNFVSSRNDSPAGVDIEEPVQGDLQMIGIDPAAIIFSRYQINNVSYAYDDTANNSGTIGLLWNYST